MEQKNSNKNPMLMTVVITFCVIAVIGVVAFIGFKFLERVEKPIVEEPPVEEELLEEQEIKPPVEEKQQIEPPVEEKQVKDVIIEDMKERMKAAEKRQKELEAKIEEIKGGKITMDEIQPYLTGVVAIECFDKFGFLIGHGSGILQRFAEPFRYAVLTNEHVVTADPDGKYGVFGAECYIQIINPPYPNITFWLDTDGRTFNWHEETDVAVVPILSDKQGIPVNQSPYVRYLNFTIGELPFCAPRMPLGAPVKVIGYPAFAQETCPFTGVTTFSRTVTEGTISAYRKGLWWEEIFLPHLNYFVTATVDTGNSGGIALSKDAGGLCILGIPTWLVKGRHAEQGIIQNIHNLFQDW